jgi:hypothetical protein
MVFEVIGSTPAIVVFHIWYATATTGDNLPSPPVAVGVSPAIEPRLVTFVRSRERARVRPRTGAASLHRGKRVVAAWLPRA